MSYQAVYSLSPQVLLKAVLIKAKGGMNRGGQGRGGWTLPISALYPIPD